VAFPPSRPPVKRPPEVVRLSSRRVALCLQYRTHDRTLGAAGYGCQTKVMAVLAEGPRRASDRRMGGWRGCVVMEGEGGGWHRRMQCARRGEINGLSKGFFSSKGFSCEGVLQGGGRLACGFEEREPASDVQGGAALGAGYPAGVQQLCTRGRGSRSDCMLRAVEFSGVSTGSWVWDGMRSECRHRHHSSRLAGPDQSSEPD